MNPPHTPFRLNPQVVHMLAVVLLAMAIPLVVLILGIRGFSSKPAAPTPEVPGLRAALEQVASKTLPPAELGTGYQQVVLLPGHVVNPLERQKAIERCAGELGGATLLTEQKDGRSRVLVQIPAAAAARFEEVALPGFSSSSAPDPAGDTRLYEIIIPPP